ncbi:MAG: putative spermidine/putrescine transport system substrate-binding protein [Acetobacteraceae bacterium]|jgi:putative spermidine/putrescine transport system substrate-binding protein|nr:putative spermidine/putrescine transport system substrate-binding protein [Acetobacteraceae bacterium]
MRNVPGFSRRTVLAGVLAAPALVSPALVTRAGATETFVLGTWGGDYQRLQLENIELPLVRQLGLEAVIDAGDEAPRVGKVLATRRLPRGPLDVVCVQAVQAYALADAGVLEELTPEKIPNLAHVKQALGTATFAPHIWSPQIVSYSPERVTSPPTSFGDLLDPRYNGKVGFPDNNFFYVMMAAGLFAGGSANDFVKAKEVMTKVNANGLRLYPSTDAGGPPFKTGEIDIGMMWLARISMWQNAGIPVAAAFPKEGCILYVSGMVVPKNAPNKEAAFKYINAMLDPAAQLGFARNMGYLPTVTNAPLTGKVAEQLALPDPAPKLIMPDFAVTTKIQPEIADWWKKSIQHG